MSYSMLLRKFFILSFILIKIPDQDLVGRKQGWNFNFYIPSGHIIFPVHPGSITFNLGKTHFILPAQHYVPADIMYRLTTF